jgi:hypothetical protein
VVAERFAAPGLVATHCSANEKSYLSFSSRHQPQ